MAAVTHPGNKRQNNEDRYSVSAHRLGDKNSTPSLLAVLADGVGGHRAGEVAAEMAVQLISKFIAESDADRPPEILAQAMSLANQSIAAHAASDSKRSGMGATCVCAWVIGERLYAAWAGDSRLYLVRAGQIQQLTSDHTWVQEALECGALTPEQARNHPNAHVIHRYLGSSRAGQPDLRLHLKPEESDEQAEANQGMPLLPGDRLLLCSDGLTDLVNNDEILNALHTLPREKAVQALVELALSRGGHDNVTVIVLEMPESGVFRAERRQKIDQERPSVQVLLSCLIISGMVILGIVVTGILIWYLKQPPSTKPTATSTLAPLIAPSGSTLLPFSTVTEETTPAPPAVPVEKIISTPTAPAFTSYPTHTLRPPGQGPTAVLTVPAGAP